VSTCNICPISILANSKTTDVQAYSRIPLNADAWKCQRIPMGMGVVLGYLIAVL